MAEKRHATSPLTNPKSKRATLDTDEEAVRIRVLVDFRDAALLDENATAIEEGSGAKLSIGEVEAGCVEKTLAIIGSAECVAKALNLAARALHGIPLDTNIASDATSARHTLRLLVPHIYTTPFYKPPSKLTGIISETNAQLTLSPSQLPLSTERTLIVQGTPDEIHLAIYQIAQLLKEQQDHITALQNGAKPAIVYFTPLPVQGTYAHPDTFKLPRIQESAMMHAGNPYGATPQGQVVQQAQVGVSQVPQQAAVQGSTTYQQGPQQHIQGPTVQQALPYGGQQGAQQQAQIGPGGTLTQQIYIPNDMVGAIIGKGGAKINEIRQMSGSHIKINEPAENSNERLVTITGSPECNQMALYMLYSRLESEKHRV